MTAALALTCLPSSIVLPSQQQVEWQVSHSDTTVHFHDHYRPPSVRNECVRVSASVTGEDDGGAAAATTALAVAAAADDDDDEVGKKLREFEVKHAHKRYSKFARA